MYLHLYSCSKTRSCVALSNFKKIIIITTLFISSPKLLWPYSLTLFSISPQILNSSYYPRDLTLFNVINWNDNHLYKKSL